MSGIARRIIRAQDFPAIVERRRRNYALLSDLLADVAPPVQGPLPHGVRPPFYAAAVVDKKGVLARLRAKGIEAINFWEYHHPALPPGSDRVVDELRRTVLELPCHQDLGPEAIGRVAAAVRDVVGAARPGEARRLPSRRASSTVAAGSTGAAGH